MDLLEILTNNHNKQSAHKIAEWVGNDPDKLDSLLEIFLNSSYKICQRAAWSLGLISNKYPEIFMPHTESLLQNLENTIHDAVVRNTLKIWQSMDIPTHLEGRVYDKCFELLTSKKSPVAIKVFSMTILTNIACRHPGLNMEVKELIELQYDTETAGYKARARHELKRLI